MIRAATPSETFSTAPPEAATSGAGLSGLKRSATLALSRRLTPLLRTVSCGEIGGETLADAWSVAQRIVARGDTYTLGLWDDASYRPGELVDEAHGAIERIAGSGTSGYLSIKPPALGFDSAVARELGRAAARTRVRLHCDSHGIEVADRTFAFLGEMAREAPSALLSVSIPGRWRRSLSDATRMLRAGIGIRIVKGQWPDADGTDADLADGFLAVVDAIQGSEGRIALASHDARLIGLSAERLGGTPYEIEFIQGLETPLLRQLAAASGRPPCVYIPYGRGFIPSALQTLRRNPRLALSLVRAALSPQTSR